MSEDTNMVDEKSLEEFQKNWSCFNNQPNTAYIWLGDSF